MLQTQTGDPLLARFRQEVPRGTSNATAFPELFFFRGFSARIPVTFGPEPAETGLTRVHDRWSRMSARSTQCVARRQKNTVVFKRFIDYIAMT